MAETEAVARRLGIEMPITIDQRIAGAEKVGEHKTSMLQDLEAGRPLELDAIVGAVLELGERLGVAMPHTRAVYACAKLLERQRRRHAVKNRWAQLAASLVAMIMIANLQYAWTLFVEPIRQATGWKLSDIQWGFTLFIVFETWVMPLEGWLIDRMGPRIFTTIAGVLCGFGWSGLAYATTRWQLYAFYAIAGIGAAFVYSGSIASALKWFPDRRGLAAGIIAGGFGSGAALFIPVHRRHDPRSRLSHGVSRHRNSAGSCHHGGGADAAASGTGVRRDASGHDARALAACAATATSFQHRKCCARRSFTCFTSCSS